MWKVGPALLGPEAEHRCPSVLRLAEEHHRREVQSVPLKQVVERLEVEHQHQVVGMPEHNLRLHCFLEPLEKPGSALKYMTPEDGVGPRPVGMVLYSGRNLLELVQL